MNTLEALNLIYQAASMALLTKQQHIQVEQAFVVLRQTMEQKTAEDPKEAPVEA